MLNKTFIGIAQKLNQVFGDSHEIHIGSIKQGLSEPCFLINVLNPSYELIISNTYLLRQKFNILYYPENKVNQTEEINSVISTLQTEMEYISVDNEIVRGTKISSEIIDETLHFFVNYDIRVVKNRILDPYMEELSQMERVKM